MMGTYWDEFINRYHDLTRYPLTTILEAFYHYCLNDKEQTNAVFAAYDAMFEVKEPEPQLMEEGHSAPLVKCPRCHSWQGLRWPAGGSLHCENCGWSGAAE